MCAVFRLLLGVCATSQATELFDFDNGSDGWTTSTIQDSGAIRVGAPDFVPAAGNPNGYVSACIDYADPRLYGFHQFDAGIMGDLTGLTLTVDTRLIGQITGPGTTPAVRFYVGSYTSGNNYYMSNDLFSWDINNDTNWTNHTVTLSVENFVLWPNSAANSKTFAQVIAQPEDIGLLFTDDIVNFSNNAFLGISSSTGAVIEMDNFGTAPVAVPEPLTMVFLGTGLLATIRPWRRKSRPN